MMVTKQTLHVAGVVRSPQLQYELSEALAEDIGTEVDLRVGGLKAWAPGLLVAERTPSVLLLEIDPDDREEMAALGPLSAEASRSHVPIVATATAPRSSMCCAARTTRRAAGNSAAPPRAEC